MSGQANAGSYIHGTDPQEQGRLSVMNDLLNAAALRELALAGGEKVLDLGSGLGQFTRAVARAAGPAGRVVGIEGNPRQLSEALRLARQDGEEGLADLRQGDAREPPLRDDEWGSFDLAHARFLLEHVSDPLAVVRTMVRAVRPGGRLVLADDDHDVLRLHPEPPGLTALWQAYMRTYDRLGNDPSIGRRLPALLHAAGARPRRVTWVFFGGCAGQDTFPVVVANLLEILRGARPTMEAHGLVDPHIFDATLAGLEAWGQRLDASFWYAMSWAEGVRPAGGSGP
jgi:ubiquinone/menaquinone biosynthesis C-methylase UbiE